ncbi:MAG: hypothetical protein KGK00_15375 [Paracoccaceae bacterium]|nr:hypothetical protein [Paracoccaceae bacterium]
MGSIPEAAMSSCCLQQSEGAASGDKPFLAVATLFFDRGEFRHLRKDQACLLGLVDRDTVSKVEHGEILPSPPAAGTLRAPQRLIFMIEKPGGLAQSRHRNN